jgi:hypothetical protein
MKINTLFRICEAERKSMSKDELRKEMQLHEVDYKFWMSETGQFVTFVDWKGPLNK